MRKTIAKGVKTKAGKRATPTSKVPQIGKHRRMRTNAVGMDSNKKNRVVVKKVSSSRTMVTPVTARSDAEAIDGAFVTKSHASFVITSAQSKSRGKPTNKGRKGLVPQSILLPESNTVQTPSELETLTPSERWGTNVQDRNHDKARTLRELETFVKSVLFKAMKFITNEAQLEFSEKKDTLCGYVCDHLHITPTYRYEFWKDHKAKIGEKLNKKRTDVNSAMKKEYICK